MLGGGKFGFVALYERHHRFELFSRPGGARTKFTWFSELADQFVQAMSSLSTCSVEHVIDLRNKVAEEIAVSVIRDL